MATQFDDLSADEEAQMEEMRVAENEPEVQEDIPDEAADTEASEEAAEPEKEKKPETSVPYGALREERDKRQAIANELSEARDQMRRMEEAWQRTVNRQPEAPAPNFDDDPDAYNAWKLEQIDQRQQRIEQQTVQQQTRAQQQEQEQQFLNRYASAVEDYAAKQPDVQDAYAHVYEMRDKELRLAGYSDDKRKQIMEFEERTLVENAFRAGDNPADRIYELARIRGYSPKQADKVQTLQRGQQASRSLANTRGGGEVPVTLARLAELDGDEFDKAWASAQKKGLLG